jgi:hypothetical protein
MDEGGGDVVESEEVVDDGFELLGVDLVECQTKGFS